MQMITSRQNRLLRFLLPRREYTTIVTIAGYLNVSEKTIQRDLRLLEQWLGQWRINVEKRAGVRRLHPHPETGGRRCDLCAGAVPLCPGLEVAEWLISYMWSGLAPATRSF